MPKRKSHARYVELVEDADAALRMLSRRYSEAFPKTTLRSGEQVASARWPLQRLRPDGFGSVERLPPARQIQPLESMTPTAIVECALA